MRKVKKFLLSSVIHKYWHVVHVNKVRFKYGAMKVVAVETRKK